MYRDWLNRIGRKARNELSSAHLQRTWIRIFHELSRPAEYKNKKAIIDTWKSVGAAHGYSSQGAMDWLAKGDNAKPVPSSAAPWARCGWSGCMCYEQKVLFRLRACTGCWREFYCGEECQKK